MERTARCTADLLGRRRFGPVHARGEAASRRGRTGTPRAGPRAGRISRSPGRGWQDRRMSGMVLDPYTDADLDKLHAAAKTVLERTGARIMTEEARQLLLDHGGTQEGEDLVRIPGDLVERALETAPKRFWIYDRGGEPTMELGAGNVYVGAGVTNLNYLDPRDFQVKDFNLRYTAESTLLADALPNLDFVATPGVTRPLPDLPLEIVNQEEFVAMTTNTTKPLMVLIAGEPELRDIYDMAELIAGGPDALREKPFVLPYLNSVSPLLFNLETIDKLFLAADR
ncbi:MAG: trimethylamine methyltransferase family protein, partial [Actinomycetota bacterium]